MTGSAHFHLAWYGYELCHRDPCPYPVADESEDMICEDSDCEGNCEAARYNTERRLRAGLF